MIEHIQTKLLPTRAEAERYRRYLGEIIPERSVTIYCDRHLVSVRGRPIEVWSVSAWSRGGDDPSHAEVDEILRTSRGLLREQGLVD